MDRWMTNLFKDKSGVLANSGIKIDPGLFESYWIMVILIFFISPFQIMVDFWIIINHKPFHFFSTILFFFIILCYSQRKKPALASYAKITRFAPLFRQFGGILHCSDEEARLWAKFLCLPLPNFKTKERLVRWSDWIVKDDEVRCFFGLSFNQRSFFHMFILWIFLKLGGQDTQRIGMLRLHM